MQTRYIIWVLVLLGALIPIAAYYFLLERVPSVTPEVAKEELAAQPQATALLDVRNGPQWNRYHLDFAHHLPLEKLLELDSATALPKELQGKKLFVICASGVSSVKATEHLRQLSVQAVNVRGGIQEWIADAIRDQAGDPYESWTSGDPLPDDETARLEAMGITHTYSPFMQTLAFIAAFIAKPTYTLLSLALIILLWIKNPMAEDRYALRWGLIAFFLGENACAINYILFNEKSYIFEFLHMYGMLVAAGLIAYATLEAIDARVLRTTGDRPCALLGLCHRCIKTTDVSCPMRQLFLVGLPALMLISLMPAGSDWHTTSYNTVILGTPYNYTHLAYQQLFECFVCPVLAIAAMAVSLLITLKHPRPTRAAKIALCVGLGPLAFGMFRTVLAGMYDHNRVWFNFWEEITELITILGIAAVLWIFRSARTEVPAKESKA